MKNYVLLYLSVAGDGAGGELGFVWTFTLAEGQNYLDTTGSGGSGQSGPTLYYVLLNKNIVSTLVGLASVAAGHAFVAGLATTDAETAQNFGVENPGSQPWTFDDTDQKWSENVKLAKQRVVETGKTKVGTLHLTVFQIVATAIAVLTPIRATNVSASAAIGDFTRLLNLMIKKKVTDSQALLEYEKIIARYPFLFSH